MNNIRTLSFREPVTRTPFKSRLIIRQQCLCTVINIYCRPLVECP
jgi:hypothetical protein